MQIAPLDPADRDAVNAVGTAAYAQFEDVYSDWERFSAGAANLAALDDEGTVLVAKDDGGRVLGAVGYFAPGAPRPEFFDPDAAVIRMLAVHPAARGSGLGRFLTDACIQRARADGAGRVALHTSPAMEVALNMYLGMGFQLHRRLPDRFGVPYAVYAMEL